MRLTQFNEGRVGVVRDGHVVDLSSLLPGPAGSWPPVGMVQAIAEFPVLRDQIDRELNHLPCHALTDIELRAPISWPHNFFALPTNYQSHITEMNSASRATRNGFFLKASSSLIGPHEQIVLPDVRGPEIHHECELALVIGTTGRNIPPDKAMDYVFGYTCLIDVTIRGHQERVMRKSYDTFAPLGPYITTADEVRAPGELDLELSVNGQRRQSGNTRDMILSIPEMISLISSAATLVPGDLIATGTPEGVGPLRPGDRVRVAIQDVGEMTLPVVRGEAGYNITFSTAGQGADR